jgi:hypothetical protein
MWPYDLMSGPFEKCVNRHLTDTTSDREQGLQGENVNPTKWCGPFPGPRCVLYDNRMARHTALA